MKVLAHHSFYLRGPSLIPKTQREIYNSLIGNYLPQLLLINQGTTLSTMWIKPSLLDLRCQNLDHDKGKTSSEVEPNIIAPIQSLEDYELLMEDFKDDLKELSDEEMYEVEDEMEDAFPLNNEVAKNNWEKHEEAPTSYDDLKWEVEDFHETTFRAASNTDAHMRNFEKILTQDKAQHVKGINKILPNLKESVGPRLTKIQNTQAIIQIDMATLKTDTADIKAMVTEIFYAFKGQAFSASSESMPKPTLAITGGDQEELVTQADLIQTVIPTTIIPEAQVTESTTQPITTESTPIIEEGGSSQITPRVDKGNSIATEDDPSPPKLVKASREVIMDHDIPMLIK
ncbi:hypothetical protein Tco_0587674 [Tanacetum coccineum]